MNFDRRRNRIVRTTRKFAAELTFEYHRVAMIWNEPCPHCRRDVNDWFVEWCSEAQQREIGRQKRAIDCPWCKEPVLIRGLRALAPPPGFQPEEPARRDYQLATNWAQQRYPSLEAFLQDPDPHESARAAPFRRDYWLNVNLPDPPIPGTQP